MWINTSLRGRSLRDRISFRFQVVDHSAGHSMGCQRGHCYYSGHSCERSNPTPNMPNLPGRTITLMSDYLPRDPLGNPIFAQPPKVTVVGGGKSSVDMVYACVKAGKTVSWVIRASGTGPVVSFVSPKGKWVLTRTLLR